MKFRKKAYRSRAIAGVWVTVMFLAMIPMLGWAMDMSYVAYVVQKLQVAADAAALAGAAEAKTDIPLARLRAQATSAANTAGTTAGVPDPVLMDLNAVNLPDGDIVTGRYYRWDDTTTDPPHFAGDFDTTAAGGAINAVKAVARRTETSLNGKLPLLCGPIFGVDTTEVSRDAIALVVGATGAGLIVLCDDCDCALEFSGSTQLTLDTTSGYDGDAAIQVNSDATGCNNSAAVCGDGSSLTIDAPEINIVAEGPESSCFNANAVVPPLNPGSPSIPDPLAGLPEPTIDYSADRGCIGNSACVFLCDDGPLEGSSCVTNSDCPQGGKCLGALVACEGGSNDSYACMSDADCPGGLCKHVPQLCFEGANADMACMDNADCPGGLCLTTVRAHSGYYSGGFRMNSAKSNLILDGGVYSLDNAEAGLPRVWSSTAGISPLTRSCCTSWATAKLIWRVAATSRSLPSVTRPTSTGASAFSSRAPTTSKPASSALATRSSKARITSRTTILSSAGRHRRGQSVDRLYPRHPR